MAQYGFFFDQSRCTSCGACAAACKDWNDLPPGPVKYLRIYQWEKGTWPNPRVHVVVAPCYHCESPSCVDVCPNQAIYKEDKYGAVLIDQEKCNGTRQCWVACPYGAPTFDSDASGTKAQKCHMCIDRLEQGLKPICVMTCPQRALDFDTMENLQKRYGINKDLEDMPSSSQVKPAVIFKPHLPKKQLVLYDVKRALEINAKRPHGSPLYRTPDDVIDIPEGLITRSKPVLKGKNVAEFIHYTRNTES